MTKTDLIAKVAEQTGLTKKDADKAVSAVFDVVTETLAAGEKVAIAGFGTFEVRDRASRKGLNPRTKEEIVIPASKLPAFKAGRGLKGAVAEKE